MKINRLVLAGAALVALAACGSATDSITFKAPANYTPKAQIGPFMQVWTTADKHSALILMQLPTKVSLDDIMSQTNVKDAQVKVKRTLTICNNQPAIYAEMTGTTGGMVNVGTSDGDTKTTQGDVDVLGTNVNGHTYMAMYVREKNAASDPAAVAAIHDICPK
ncbi:MAG: hypothetical protein KGN02_12175 [bacterium]|nr:hypothetical protein [bacterium]